MIDVRQMCRSIWCFTVSQNGEADEYLYSRTCLNGNIKPHVGKSTVPVGFGTWGAGLDQSRPSGIGKQAIPQAQRSGYIGKSRVYVTV